jgi:hypothetical protein
MVDLSIVFCKRLPEGKPPFSYGFPMVFPLKPPFSYGLPGRVDVQTNGAVKILAKLDDLPKKWIK